MLQKGISSTGMLQQHVQGPTIMILQEPFSFDHVEQLHTFHNCHQLFKAHVPSVVLTLIP